MITTYKKRELKLTLKQDKGIFNQEQGELINNISNNT